VSPGPHLSWLLSVVTVWQTKLSGRISRAEGARRRTHKTFLRLKRWANKGMVGFVHLNEMRIRVSGIWSWGLRLKESLAKGRVVFSFAKGKDSIRLHPLSLSLSLSLSELKFFSFPKSKLEIVCGTLDATWRFLLWLASQQWSLEFKCEDSVRRRWWMHNPK